MGIIEGTKTMFVEVENTLHDRYFSTLKKIEKWETSWEQMLSDTYYISSEKTRIRDNEIKILQEKKASISLRLQEIDSLLRPPSNNHYHENNKKQYEQSRLEAQTKTAEKIKQQN